MTARFVAFEGGDASGKSTQAQRLATELDAVLTREPGGTPAGEAIRALFLDPATGDLDPRTEALLLAAARAQHAAEVIRPALQQGRHVVTDRYLYSSVAYQGHARGLEPDDVRNLSLWATAELEPDAVVLLDLPVDIARGRVAGVAPDRLESEDGTFHQRVRDGYLAQAAADADRWIVVDADQRPDDVWDDVWRGLAERLPDLAT